jgi:MFS transporter, SHS family, lactate transporter
LVSERAGRRWALIIPCTIGIFLVPLYLMSVDPIWIVDGFLLQVCFAGGKDTLNPAWLSERFPTEIRASAAEFVYHQGAVWGAFVAPIIAYFAVEQKMGFATPMIIGTIGSLVVLIIAVFLVRKQTGRSSPPIWNS